MQSSKIKNLSWIIILCLSGLTLKSEAQQLSLDEVLQTLENMQVFQENRKLHKRVLDEMTHLQRKTDLSVKDYEELEWAYTRLQYLYNQVYLGSIKSDLSNYREVKRMVSRIGVYSAKYADAYERVVEHYNQHFVPVVQRIEGGQQMGDLATALKIGGYLFEKIVAVISKRKEDKEALLQVVISTANRLLFKKLMLPEWESLGIQKPGVQIGNPGQPVQFVQPKAVQTPLVHQALNTDGLKAKIRFMQWLPDGEVAMPFKMADQRPVSVQDFQGMGDMILGQPGQTTPAPTTQVEAFRLRSQARFEAGTFYKLHAQTNGLIYVFAVNSNNKMYGFYPLKGELNSMSSLATFDLPPNADQILGNPSSPAPAGVGEIQIPDRSHYIQISDAPGSAVPEAETLVVIISRAELNMRDILQQMENLGANYSAQERLAMIFGTQAATPEQAQLSIQNGTIHAHIPASDVHVLPLTFAILRK